MRRRGRLVAVFEAGAEGYSRIRQHGIDPPEPLDDAVGPDLRQGGNGKLLQDVKSGAANGGETYEHKIGKQEDSEARAQVPPLFKTRKQIDSAEEGHSGCRNDD